MKKILAVIMASAVVVGLLSGCGSKEVEKASEEIQKAAEVVEENLEEGKGTFTVGFDQEFPPYGYVGDDGEFTGFDLDLAAEVANRLDLELVLTPIDWDAKDMELNSGAIDCIWSGFTINGREDLYTWSKPYTDNSQVFVVKKASGIEDFDDLAGSIVEVQTDSSAQQALDSEEFAELKATFDDYILVPNYNQAFMDLESGAVDAVAMDIGVARFQIEGKEDTYRILEEPIVSELYGIGFLKGNEELRDKVQEAMDEIVADGTFAAISNKYFGYDVGLSE
ncbi:MAG: amino acid ABC transporter substrate-binding protein [Firmicutes bacterium]|nr:amino acid ABC transporter substrate-binding protein [Bacillota bacterium]MBR2594372.1 amino acid ABC transporter substrate-binding protein [Bacillota bacterium]